MHRSSRETDSKETGGEDKLAESTDKMMSVITRWSEEVWHQGKLELVPQLVGPVYVRHEPGRSHSVTPQEYEEEIAAIRERLPDLRFTEHDRVVSGDKYWLRWSYEGTDSESGRVVKRAGIQIYRFENGKIVETWFVMNQPGSSWEE